ncbi:glycoside hydrolase family 2 protein [Myriangium duriaei CBS 260.36]|uniref:Beta-mannosidase B n=1 Tax=Myriangium duriaei CBS 260.36 TaxID=1168546 RepID=A0A9P4IQX1_9PEZI|nr:glycoside hydrolase family 2 protein [Myriangium duriaei CBS 260.36]
MATSRTTHVLDKGWEFKQTNTERWLPVAHVPTNVHIDLMDNGEIEDPFIGFNELKCEWVGNQSWTYKTSLPSVSIAEHGQRLVLALDGLDTYAIVKVDNKIIHKSDNMWIIHRIDITDVLNTGGEHVLEIEFASALLEARKVKDAHPEHTWVGFNGEMSRLAARKAQYHWGWDWGPVLMTCGPWRQVRLETYHIRISDIRVDYQVSSSLKSVSGSILVQLEGEAAETVYIYAVTVNGGQPVFQGSADVSSNGTAQVDFHINDPDLWYPHGYGKQTLYDVVVTAVKDRVQLDTASRRIGFRKAELVQEPDENGKSFYFRINEIDVFCCGSDWIPADSLTPRITTDRYRKWLQMMVDGYQVMIRVWGGGIWEEDCFYDICDELGILIWHDFMFGCGNYPAFPEILESVKRECTDQVKRLRHHPSIVIYAGNNEDYQVQEQFNLKYDYEDKEPTNWLKSDFPARFIYEKLLPDVVSEHAPHVAYHPGSPWGDGKRTSDPTVGDMHQWNVWHGTQEKYQIFDTLGGRFNSEFGMEAFPHIDTIKWYVTDSKQLYPQSHMIDFHNKADGHERRIATYLVENFRTSTDLEKFIHLTQLSQAEALMFGYRGWRKQWGEKRHCGGALVWQLNDCWPVTSWSIVDYFLRKKPAYYAMRRVLAPVAIAVKRQHHDWSVVHARPAPTSTWECWVASSRTTKIKAKAEIRFISIESGDEIKESLIKKNVEIVPNGTTYIAEGIIDNQKDEPHVLAARIWIDDEIVGRDVDFPQPLKYDNYDNRGVIVKQTHERIAVTAERPTKGLVFEEREGVLVNDSAVDVVPGDEQIITIKGLKAGDEPLKWLYYGM